eukprot:2326284-Pyramimonas_sp.AAC.1
MEVGGGSRKLEVAHVYGEYQAQFLVSPHAFPTRDGLETNALQARATLVFPKHTCQGVSVECQAESAHRVTVLSPGVGLTPLGERNPRVDRVNLAVSVQ